MQKCSLAIIEKDLEYVDYLLQYIRTSDFTDRCKVAHFTDIMLFQQQKQPRCDLIILHEEFLHSREVVKLESEGKIIILTENEEVPKDESYSYVYKYQPVSTILASILPHTQGSRYPTEDTGTNLIAIYSSSGGAGKTTLSLTLARQLVLFDYKVLYINLELISSTEDFLYQEEEDHFSRLLYYAQSNPELLQINIQKCIRHDPALKFDYILPLHHPRELCEQEEEIFAKVVLAIREAGYDYVVFDLDKGAHAFIQSTLSNSDRILWLVSDDFHSVSKTNAQLKELKKTDHTRYEQWLQKSSFLCNKFTGEGQMLRTEQHHEFAVSDFLPYIPEWKNISHKDQMFYSTVFNEKLIQLKHTNIAQGDVEHA